MNEKINAFLKKYSKILFLSILAIIGILLIITSEKEQENYDKTYSHESMSLFEYQEILKTNLENTLNSISKNQITSVMITFESGFENVYSDISTHSQSDIFSYNSDNAPVIIKTKNPKIAGVMIVCNNIYDAQSITEIKKAAATCLNINENKIYIIGGTVTQ